MKDDDAWKIRSFDRLLATLNHGDDNAEATRLMNQMIDRLVELNNNHGGKYKGAITSTVTFEIDEKGGLDITLSSKAKIPGPPIARERFFLTDHNELTMQDPARGELLAGMNLGWRRTMPDE